MFPEPARTQEPIRTFDLYVRMAAIKIKNIAIGYNLPQTLFNNAFEKLRVYASIQNALTITKYSGYDPEISSDSPIDKTITFQRGIDMYQRPNPRIVRLGVQLTF